MIQGVSNVQDPTPRPWQDSWVRILMNHPVVICWSKAIVCLVSGLARRGGRETFTTRVPSLPLHNTLPCRRQSSICARSWTPYPSLAVVVVVRTLVMPHLLALTQIRTLHIHQVKVTSQKLPHPLRILPETGSWT
uniref:Uncharacterized protein n=1 Tax=Cacopsylla melanoneura TaxID=428564 RepID=A0A8D8WJ87_9HEMI